MRFKNTISPTCYIIIQMACTVLLVFCCCQSSYVSHPFAYVRVILQWCGLSGSLERGTSLHPKNLKSWNKRVLSLMKWTWRPWTHHDVKACVFFWRTRAWFPFTFSRYGRLSFIGSRARMMRHTWYDFKCTLVQ